MTFVRKFLDISTGNVTRATMDLIEKQGLPISSYTNEYGAFVYVPRAEEGSIVNVADLPEDLRKVMEIARREGCGYILFDRDADPHPELECHDW